MYCHEATQIVPGLILGGFSDLEDIISKLDPENDVLVPLDESTRSSWKPRWNGRVIEHPIKDYGILPDDELDELVTDIVDLIRPDAHPESGCKVGIFCIGGHGRTGYVAACVLYRLGVRNPFEFLHSNYCIKAIETEEQRAAVIRFIKRN